MVLGERLAQLEAGLAELVQRRNIVAARREALKEEAQRLGLLIARQEGAVAALREVAADSEERAQGGGQETEGQEN